MLKKYSFPGEFFFQKVAKKKFFLKQKFFQKRVFGVHTHVLHFCFMNFLVWLYLTVSGRKIPKIFDIFMSRLDIFVSKILRFIQVKSTFLRRFDILSDFIRLQKLTRIENFLFSKTSDWSYCVAHFAIW